MNRTRNKYIIQLESNIKQYITLLQTFQRPFQIICYKIYTLLYARFHAYNPAYSISLLNLNILPSMRHRPRAQIPTLIPPFAVILLMISGGRAGPETMRRGPGGAANLGGVNARLRLSGPFVSPPPDWTSQIRGRWNTIRGRLYRNLPPRLFVTSFDLAVALSVARHLCEHHGPVQTGLSQDRPR